MTALSTHALADLRHAERYARPACNARSARRRPLRGARQRLGVLLVEAGLHLITGADRSPAVSRLAH